VEVAEQWNLSRFDTFAMTFRNFEILAQLPSVATQNTSRPRDDRCDSWSNLRSNGAQALPALFGASPVSRTQTDLGESIIELIHNSDP
jgi:hypothetical protein